MPRSRKPRQKRSDVLRLEERRQAQSIARKHMLVRATLPIFVASLLPIPIAYLGVGDAGRGHRLGFCVTQKATPFVAIGFAVFALLLVVGGAMTARRMWRLKLVPARSELVLLIGAGVAGATLSLWIARNILQHGCLA